MVFPIDQERPRLIPVTLRGTELANGAVDWVPRLHGLVGQEHEVSSMIITKGVGGKSSWRIKWQITDMSSLAGETLRFPLHIFFRTHFLTDGSRT
jgi:hypothetical protein